MSTFTSFFVIFASSTIRQMGNFSFKIISWTIGLSILLGIKANAEYHDDVLGNGYRCNIIHQPDDYDGAVVCAIVQKPTLPNVKRAIIYTHGYNDYFFQSALGDSANAHGYNFYALDLRKYGRSSLPNQDPFFCKKMDEYFADIDTTIAIAKAEGNEQIFLLGHSTGGLCFSLYLNERRENAHVDGLILNSPFLDWNLGKVAESIGIPCLSFMGSMFKKMKAQGASGTVGGYSQSILKEYHGEWDFSKEWVKIYGHPKRAGWIRAIHHGQKKVQKGMKIQQPILLMSSDKSVEATDQWNEAYHRADVILNVDEIQKFGAKLGPKVTPCIIKDGKHDLLLSEKAVRDEVYRTIFQWLEKQ